ncbi:hypothetical protein TCON_0993 [Astathelohania contejeani]|uniref:Uncharacterized protein n=1 Tax=Astathelohania contejeani TaxID=164912 RepID=A0ABQ7I009_9MICR|nr:hypothetical protein TCON_0993 [Thelohania contejeani]
MRYLQLSPILETNTLLQSIEEKDNGFFTLLEVYSCKYTKKQKKETPNYKSTLSFLTNTLDLCFSEYKFSNLEMKHFQVVDEKEVKLEISTSLVGRYMDGYEVGGFIMDVIIRVVGKDSIIYRFNERCGPFENCLWFHCYLFYSKKRKRVLILVIGLNKM